MGLGEYVCLKVSSTHLMKLQYDNTAFDNIAQSTVPDTVSRACFDTALCVDSDVY